MPRRRRFTVTYVAPWVERVAALQSKAAIDVDAERDVARLTEEVRVMSHAMRTKVRNSPRALRLEQHGKLIDAADVLRSNCTRNRSSKSRSSRSGSRASRNKRKRWLDSRPSWPRVAGRKGRTKRRTRCCSAISTIWNESSTRSSRRRRRPRSRVGLPFLLVRC